MSWQSNLKRFTEQQGEKHLLKKAEEVKNQATLNAPVRTGALRDSMEVLPVSKKKVKVGSPLSYAWFMEMGTRYIAPRAFLRRALRSVIK
jgi:HK97 gp10 family phage protein